MRNTLYIGTLIRLWIVFITIECKTKNSIVYCSWKFVVNHLAQQCNRKLCNIVTKCVSNFHEWAQILFNCRMSLFCCMSQYYSFALTIYRLDYYSIIMNCFIKSSFVNISFYQTSLVSYPNTKDAFEIDLFFTQ